MTDGLSAAASVIAVVACAGEFSKLLFDFIHEVKSVPEHVRHLTEAIESLRITLLRLQRCLGGLSPNLYITPQFDRRLRECLVRLKLFNHGMANLDQNLNKQVSGYRGWEQRAKRSIYKVKWLTTEKRKTQAFLEDIRLYQAEFALELLMLIL